MFDNGSRYFELETVQWTTPEGRVVAYKRRRFLPRGEDIPVQSEITVKEGDRLDLIAGRTLGDPELFWRICDANNAMNPLDLMSERGETIRVPLPES